MKSAYALTFLGLCAIVLLVHVNHNENVEQMKEAEDPFLATLEARVVAKAQARLRKTRAARATKDHIASVKEAIRKSLQSAADTSSDSAAEEELDTMREDAAAMGLSPEDKKGKAKKMAVAKAKKKNSVKQFTWDELQAGADAPRAAADKKAAQKQKVAHLVAKVAQRKTGSLLQNLKAAPRIKVAKAPVEKEDAVHAALNKARESQQQAHASEPESADEQSELQDDDESDETPEEAEDYDDDFD